MATLPLTEAYGGLGSYEALLNWLIRRREESRLAKGEARPASQVGGHVTLGFGYDLATRKDKSRPYWILSDLASAGIELTITQLAAVLFYVGQSRDDIEHYLDDLATHGTPVTPDDRRFVQKLSAYDRTDDGLFAKLQGVTVTQTQGEALLRAVVQEKETQFDAFLRDPKNKVPQDVRDQLKVLSDQRAVLVDMFYQSADFFGPQLLQALRAGDAAAAALEIAFLSNKKPREFPGIDARNLARAETFFGGTFAPRTKAEAEAVLRAIAGRADALAQALANRQGPREYEEKYRQDLQALVKASLAPFGIDTTLTPQADGSFKVGKEVPLERLAEAFGLSPLALALVNPELFPTPPDDFTKFPADKLLHMPTARERGALAGAHVGITWAERQTPLTPEAYDELRRRLAPSRQSPPWRGHASLESDELLAQFSPASLEIAETPARQFSPALDPAVVRRLFPELEALPILGPADDLRELTAAVGFGSTSGLEFLAPRKEDYLTADGFAPLMRYSTARRGFDRATLERIEAAIARCITQAERLDREVDRWIERRNALRRPRPFDPY
ncbi:MAG: hypothetical protein ACHQRJ_10725 [Alphaproteobacteria bacterium]